MADKRIGLFSRNLHFILSGLHVTLTQAKHSLASDDVYKLFCGADEEEVNAAVKRLGVLRDKAIKSNRYAYASVLGKLRAQLSDYI